MKALVTFAVGKAYEEMLEIALPTFERFAERHGYDLLIPRDVGDERPPSWMKIPVLGTALSIYDEVLWVDADAVIVDDSEDLDVPEGYWQALAIHRTPDGEVPSCGSWFLRTEMIPVLEQAWEMTQYLGHPWWEQRAICELMGFDGYPLRRVRETELSRKTYELDNGWSVHPKDTTPFSQARIRHATPGMDRAAAMREWLSLAEVPG